MQNITVFFPYKVLLTPIHSIMSNLLFNLIEPFAKLAHDNDITNCDKNCRVTSLSANCDKWNGETDNKVCNADCGAGGADNQTVRTITLHYTVAEQGVTIYMLLLLLLSTRLGWVSSRKPAYSYLTNYRFPPVGRQCTSALRTVSLHC